MSLVVVGEKLPPLVSAPITTTQLVQYAGASGDWNRIHYDEPFAREGGFPTVIAHGMLSMAFFARLLSGWCGPERIRRLSARFRAVTYPGDVITVSGEVTRLDGDLATVRLQAHKHDGTLTLEGSADVELRRS